MNYTRLHGAGFEVSKLSFGASALGGVFGEADEEEAIWAVHAALECGINYFDVAPAYGGGRSEIVLGRALRGIARDRYRLSTKVGKYTDPSAYGRDTYDYSRERLRASLDESARNLGTDYFDIVHLHDFEMPDGRHTEWALREGLAELQALKRAGRIGAVGMGIYPLDLWWRVLRECDFDVALVHNHYCLNDRTLLGLLPSLRERSIGVINGSPFASRLLTDAGPADWHPADSEARQVFRRAAEFCRSEGTSIARLALQFSSQHPDIPTTLFSSAQPESVRRNVAWHEQPVDRSLLAAVEEILQPVMNRQWSY